MGFAGCGRAWLLLAILLGLFAGSCALPGDRDRFRLCRQVLPILHPAGATIQIEDRRQEGSAVIIRYRAGLPELAGLPEGRPPSRHVTCRFSDAVFGAERLELQSVIENGRPVSEAMLLFTSRFWLPSSDATESDPGDAASAAALPQLDVGLAVGLQHLLASLPMIAIYLMLAPAYALVYGLVGRINLAFGELAALGATGATLGLLAASTNGVALGPVAVLAAVLAAVFVAGSHGAAAGRFIFLPLAGRPGQHVLVATLGLSISLQEYMRLTQGASIVWLPPLWNEAVPLAAAGSFVVTVTPIALGLLALAAACAIGLLMVMDRTRMGRNWRAVADDRHAAALFGVSANQVLAGTLALSSGLAAVAGAVSALHYGGMGFAGGTLLGLKALVAAILGGIGSVPGAMLGALVLGGVEALWAAILPLAWRDIAIFSFLSILLALRPGGLLGWSEIGPRQV